MMRLLRYALATFCFAASVGCLALWWRSQELGGIKSRGDEGIVGCRA